MPNDHADGRYYTYIHTATVFRSARKRVLGERGQLRALVIEPGGAVPQLNWKHNISLAVVIFAPIFPFFSRFIIFTLSTILMFAPYTLSDLHRLVVA